MVAARCAAGQGEAGRSNGIKGPMSQVQCAETCSTVTGCVAFDWTASPESDEPCRLFGKDQQPRLGQPGSHQRFYCYGAPSLDAKEVQQPPPPSSTPSSTTTNTPGQPDPTTEMPNQEGEGAPSTAEGDSTVATATASGVSADGGSSSSRQASATQVPPERIQIPDFSARSKNAADPSVVPVEHRDDADDAENKEEEEKGETENVDRARVGKNSATLEEPSGSVKEPNANQQQDDEESFSMSWWTTTAVQIALVGLGLRVWRDANSALQTTEEGATTHSPPSSTTSS